MEKQMDSRSRPSHATSLHTCLAAWIPRLAVLLTLQSGACASGTPCPSGAARADRRQDDATNLAPADAAYVPGLTAATRDRPDHLRGTLQGDLQWAARAPEIREAIVRWRQFLDTHAPKDGVYEDGAHINHVRGARVELMRAYYLAGDTATADRVLAEVFEEFPTSPCK